SFADTYTALNFGTAGASNPLTFNVGNNGTFNEFEGMGGSDTVTGNFNTRLTHTNSTGSVVVDLNAHTASGSAIGNDIVNGISWVRGSNSNDTLLGSDSNLNTNNSTTF